MQFVKVLFYGSLIIFFLSCRDHSSELNKRIDDLKSENKILRDSLKRKEYKKLTSSQLILSPHKSFSELNSKIKVSGYFYQMDNYPKFNLYYTDSEGNYEDSDKIKYMMQRDYKFEFEFIPKERQDEIINVVAIFDMDTITMKFPGQVYLPIK